MAVLAAMATPVVLLLANAMLILSTIQRLEGVLERISEVERMIAGESRVVETTNLDLLGELLRMHAGRARIAHRALLSFYGSAGLFVLVTASVGVLALGLAWIRFVALGGAFVGCALLCVGTLLLMQETRIGIRATDRRFASIIDICRDLASSRAGAGLLLMLIFPSLAWAQGSGPWTLVEEFDGDWRDRWEERELGDGETIYVQVDEGDGSILAARADASASALLRIVDAPPGRGEASWRWRIASPLPSADGRSERERDGDDFAARLFVIFGDGGLGPRTRALVYVWAASEPVGSRFPSPYVSSVATIVLRSGTALDREWVMERRDIAADYRAAFGEEPARIGGLALMADADDTGSSATAWFDGIRLTVFPEIPQGR